MWTQKQVFGSLREPTLLFLDPQALFLHFIHVFWVEILLKFVLLNFGFEAFLLKLAKKMLEEILPKNHVSSVKLRFGYPKK